MNTATTGDVIDATGLTFRQLDYACRQRCFEVTTRGSGDARRWSRLAVTQAALYAALNGHVDDRAIFAACGAIALTVHDDDFGILDGQWLVLRGTSVAIVHDAEDFAASQTMTVLSLTPIVRITRELFERLGQ